MAEANGHRLVDGAPDPAPARRLVELLAAARRAGVTFEDAWAPALDEALRGARKRDRADWLESLTWAQGHFRAAWSRQDVCGLSRGLLGGHEGQRGSDELIG